MVGHTNDPVAELLHRQLANELQAYQGNLAAACHAVQQGWLPDNDVPEVRQHLQTLRQHMMESGRPEDDLFLLRLGLTVPGTQRGIVPPLLVLDADRGGFSVRRQREAAGPIRRLQDALAIGRRLVPHLSLDTQEAVAQLVDISTVPPPPTDGDGLRSYQDLSSDQAEQLAQRALEFLDSAAESVRSAGSEILQRLACFRPTPLGETHCCALIEREILWPSSIYRDSCDVVAARLISRIDETGEVLPLNHLLFALAWTRSDTAHQALRQWTLSPPSWTSKLSVSPSEYLLSAGWRLDDDRQRRELISPRCFRLLSEGAAGPVVRCRVRIKKRCPSCGGPLAWLFDFSQASEQHFARELAEAPRKILCCLHCSCYAPTFATYRADGKGEWLSPLEPCEFEYCGGRKAHVRVIDDSPSPPFACAEPFALQDASTLGGIPMWLQDAEFPRCIECGQTMFFLAQQDNGPLGEEGIYYAFFCGPCHTAAVTYQQT